MREPVARIISLFLVLLLLIPTVVTAENSYSAKLGMTMDEFILRYNAVPTTLESPYKSLSKPSLWTEFNDYHVAWFYPESNSNIALLLLSKDKENVKSTKCGLDIIQIVSLSKEDMIPLICITKRCASIYGEDLFGISISSFAVIEAVSYYYENDLEKKGYTSYRSLNADETIALTFGYSDGYYFSIASIDDVR